MANSEGCLDVWSALLLNNNNKLGYIKHTTSFPDTNPKTLLTHAHYTLVSLVPTPMSKRSYVIQSNVRTRVGHCHVWDTPSKELAYEKFLLKATVNI